MRANPSHRGVTLIELMVAVAISGLLMVFVVQTFSHTQRSYFQGAKRRETQEQVRSAATQLEENLRLAGYGVDPSLAFDFNVYAGAGAGANCNPTGGVPTDCIRDFTDRPDEIVFYARNPNYNPTLTWGTGIGPFGRAWQVTAASPASVTLMLHGQQPGSPGEVLLPGQILQIVCTGGRKIAYARVNTLIDNRLGGPIAKLIPLRLATPGDPFSQPGLMSAGTCFGGGAARAFAIDRYRYYVAPFPDSSGERVPYLMLDQGVDRNLDGGIDASDDTPVGEGIEDMQVVYERPSGPSAGASQGPLSWVGQVPGIPAMLCSLDAAAFAPGSVPASCGVPDPPNGGLSIVNFSSIGADQPAVYSYRYQELLSPRRNSPDSANIRAVRVALTARGVSRLPGAQNGEPPTAFFNRNGSAAAWPALGAFDGYERSTLVLTVQTRNLLSRAGSYF